MSIGEVICAVRGRGGLPLFTVYDHPSDFPDHFVVRLHVAYPDAKSSGPTPFAWTFGTLGRLREELEEHGLVPLARCEEDDPTIVETWA